MTIKKESEDKTPAVDIGADWVSFTVIRHRIGNENVMLEDIHDFVDAYFPEFEIEDLPRKKIARSPYKVGYKFGIGGVLMANVLLNHFLIELQGKGCRNLINAGTFNAVAKRILFHAHNITRFDLAVDIECDTDPEEFAKMRGERFKSIGVMESATGKTCYIGSPKSERRVRVYRYYPVHERSHLMRVEFVVRKPGAENALKAYMDAPQKYAADMGNTFGFTHKNWSLESMDKITSWRPERGSASSIKWIREAVIPALERLFDDDIIDESHPIWLEFEKQLPLRVRRKEDGDGEDGA